MTARRKPEPRDDFADAMSALRRWYYTEVREWAKEYDRRIKGKEWESREDFYDALREETDSAQVVIYTAQAKACLLASDNEDEYEEQFGEKAPTVEAAACMAFQRDIIESMTADVDDESVFGGES